MVAARCGEKSSWNRVEGTKGGGVRDEYWVNDGAEGYGCGEQGDADGTTDCHCT